MKSSDRRIALARRYEAYLAAAIDETISPNDSMQNEWYRSVGESAAQVVHAACVSSWATDVRSVLDLPCGHGRVLRHLVKLFPEASFDACDLDADGVEFCARQFGARAIASKEDLTQLEFDRTYDLIWVGSLFTHTARALTKAWLAHLARFLAPHGIIVATLHGRYCVKLGRTYQYIEPGRWSKIVRAYEETGYGYQDYGSQGHAYIEGSYGVSLSKPSAIFQDVETIAGVRIFSYIERGWAGHQDVLVIGKPDYPE